MSVKTIATDELRKKFQEEGLILQGCGGDPQEWVDGINEMFTKEGILLNGTKFQNCSVFEHDGRTCILYPFGEGVDGWYLGTADLTALAEAKQEPLSAVDKFRIQVAKGADIYIDCLTFTAIAE